MSSWRKSIKRGESRRNYHRNKNIHQNCLVESWKCVEKLNVGTKIKITDSKIITLPIGTYDFLFFVKNIVYINYYTTIK